jgi:hypothetical protein
MLALAFPEPVDEPETPAPEVGEEAVALAEAVAREEAGALRVRIEVPGLVEVPARPECLDVRDIADQMEREE